MSNVCFWVGVEVGVVISLLFAAYRLRMDDLQAKKEREEALEGDGDFP